MSATPVAVTAWLGWAATAVFVGSYFFRRPTVLRGIQMLGAALWILYGALIGAEPVIVANVLVFAAAAWTLLRQPAAGTKDAGRTDRPARAATAEPATSEGGSAA